MVNIISMLHQLIVPKAQQVTVESAALGKLFQLHVTLHQSAVVFQQSVEIQRIKL